MDIQTNLFTAGHHSLEGFLSREAEPMHQIVFLSANLSSLDEAAKVKQSKRAQAHQTPKKIMLPKSCLR